MARPNGKLAHTFLIILQAVGSIVAQNWSQ